MPSEVERAAAQIVNPEVGLDQGELRFETGDERFFLFDRVAGFLDEVLGGLVDVAWVHHAGV